ncbi:hypothetical protein PAMP_001089 [Pampus punctatissimus]
MQCEQRALGIQRCAAERDWFGFQRRALTADLWDRSEEDQLMGQTERDAEEERQPLTSTRAAGRQDFTSPDEYRDLRVDKTRIRYLKWKRIRSGESQGKRMRTGGLAASSGTRQKSHSGEMRTSELQSRIVSLEQQQREAQLSAWMLSVEQVEPVIWGRLDQILEEKLAARLPKTREVREAPHSCLCPPVRLGQ